MTWRSRATGYVLGLLPGAAWAQTPVTDPVAVTEAAVMVVTSDDLQPVDGAVLTSHVEARQTRSDRTHQVVELHELQEVS